MKPLYTTDDTKDMEKELPGKYPFSHTRSIPHNVHTDLGLSDRLVIGILLSYNIAGIYTSANGVNKMVILIVKNIL